LKKHLPEQIPQYLFHQDKKRKKKKTFSSQIFEINFALEQVAFHGKNYPTKFKISTRIIIAIDITDYSPKT
jgi:hypothetical protein